MELVKFPSFLVVSSLNMDEDGDESARPSLSPCMEENDI